MEDTPLELRLQRVVPGCGPSLTLLVVPHFAIRTHSCRPLIQLDVDIESPSLSIEFDAGNELVSPLAFALPAVGHPTMGSFSLFPGEISHTSYGSPRG